MHEIALSMGADALASFVSTVTAEIEGLGTQVAVLMHWSVAFASVGASGS